MQEKPKKLTRRNAIIALTFVVAGAVGFESWQAAAAAAKTGDRPNPMLWPVTLEAFIAVLVLVYWEARSAGRPAWQARVLLALTTLLASVVQVLDVDPGKDWRLGAITAAWTPIALLLTVEFATWLLYGKTSAGAGREAAPAGGVGERAPHGPPQVQARATTPVRAAAEATSGDAAAPAAPKVARPRRTAPRDRAAARARLIREHVTESDREIIRIVRAAKVGVASERLIDEIKQAKIAANGSAHVRVDA